LGRGVQPYYWSTLSNSLKLDELNERLIQTRVIVSTISTFAASLDILNFKDFDTLIVDEASQVLEPQIVGVLQFFPKWIFIGDENQLPAVVIQGDDERKTDDKDLYDIGLHDFGESLFYRLKRNAEKNHWDDCYGILSKQFRMHSEISKFPSSTFYNNELEEVNKSQNEPLPDYSSFNNEPANQIISKGRLVFIPSKRDARAKINDEEAQLVAKIILHLQDVYNKDFDPKKTVGVITPFRAQIANIRRCLSGKCRDVTIDTVERFQGSERDHIIISLAIKDYHQLKSIQSINDKGVDRKLNVAITRAKDQLIVLGTEEILSKNKTFKSLIDFIKQNGGYMNNPYKESSLPTDLF